MVGRSEVAAASSVGASLLAPYGGRLCLCDRGADIFYRDECSYCARLGVGRVAPRVRIELH